MATDPALVPVDEAPITFRTLQALLTTPSVPERYRSSPTGAHDLLAAVLVGREIGVKPMESIGSLYLVNGRVSMEGKLMSALIHRAGHQIKAKINTQKAVVTAFRRDPYTKELNEVGSVEFGAADAKRAGLDKKPTYKEYPQMMYFWRALAMAARMFFSDCLAGIAHVPEELDVEGAEVEIRFPDEVPLEIESDGDIYEIPAEVAEEPDDE